MYLGSFEIDDTCTFKCDTHDVSTQAAADADSAPTYRVYEDETATPILTGTMALLDDANTVGQYSEQITLSAANGFEQGKSYNIRISATVGGVTGVTSRTLQVGAKVNTTRISGTTQTAKDVGGVFTGMTNLAQWIGLLAGKQAGNSTARTELRATGAGGGTFDETNDSLEAIRDEAATIDAVADGVLDEVVVGTTTFRQLLRGFAAALLGKVSGGGTTTVTFRSINDTKDVIVATVDSNGNRSALTIDLT